MSRPIIEVSGLSKKYRLGVVGATTLREDLQHLLTRFRGQAPSTPAGEFWALRDVSFSITAGEVVGILGRNGAGKSTLLKILSRITEPTEGRATLRGRVASLLEVGTGFHPDLTGRENVYLNGSILGMKNAEIASHFDEIVAFAEVEKFLDTPVKHYSSGMAVRLAFAVAAHLDAEILIIDEVLAVGDHVFQQKCLRSLSGITKSGRTVLFVSHNLAAIQQHCTQAILLSGGQLVTMGPTPATVQRYTESHLQQDAVARSRYFNLVREDGGTNNTQIAFGEPLRIELQLKNLPLDRNLGVNVSLRNAEGRTISLVSTNPHDGLTLPRRSALGLTLSFASFTLAPGEYSVDVALTEPTIRIVEDVPHAMTLRITAKASGGAWAYDARFGDFFPEHSWVVDASR